MHTKVQDYQNAIKPLNEEQTQLNKRLEEIQNLLENHKEQLILSGVVDSALNEDQGHGICKEDGCKKFAVIDYNGHGCWNCQSCHDRNERYFEDEYR